MTNVSGPFDSAIEATTRFATESTFDKLNELKFDAVKKHIKLPKSPEGFMKKLALHGVACFFNKITFSQIKCFRNWKETSGSELIKTLNFDKIADNILNKVKNATVKIQACANQESKDSIWEGLKTDLVNAGKQATGLDRLGKDIDVLAGLVLSVVLKNSDPENPSINDNALTRILQIVGTVYQGNENIRNFVDATKKTFFDVVFSKDFIHNFFEGHKHLPKVANFVVGAFHVRKVVDNVLDRFILNNPKNNLNHLGSVSTIYQNLLRHGLNSFFDLGGGKLNEIELQVLMDELPSNEKGLCKKLKEQGFWMKKVLDASKSLSAAVITSGFPNMTKGVKDYKYTIKSSGTKSFKTGLKTLGNEYKKAIKIYAESKVATGIEVKLKSEKDLIKETVNGVKKIIQITTEAVKEGIHLLTPDGDESKPRIFSEESMGKVFERGPEGLATISEVTEQMELPQEQKKTIQSIEEYHDIFDEIEDQETEMKLKESQGEKEGLDTGKVSEQMLVEEDPIAELADFPEVVHHLPELQCALNSSTIILNSISQEIKSTKIEDKNPIQDKGYTWTANYPLNQEFKKDLEQNNRITFQINGKTIEFNENAEDLAKDKIVAVHNKFVDGNSNADATNAFTEISKIANKETILKLLPKEFNEICEKQGLKLAKGNEPIDGNIQYRINVTEKNPLKVSYEISYPLITDAQKNPKGISKEVGTLKITFNTKYETIQKNGWRGWTRTYELQSIQGLSIEISEKQKQEVDDDFIL